MLLSKGPFALCVSLFLVSLLVVGTRQNSRQKRQILSDQPRIMTQNGHLVFQGGSNHNITFRSGAGGAIFINDLNFVSIAAQVTTNKASIDSIRGSSGNVPQSSIEQRLQNIENQLATMTSLSSRVDSLSTLINTVRTNLNQAINTIGARVTQVENNGGGASAGSATVVQLMSQFHAFENRVNTLIQEGQETVDTLRSQARRLRSRTRRYGRRITTLRNRMTTLETTLSTNECSSNPCVNGGTCVDLYNGYMCRCPDNWQGTRCDLDVNECHMYLGTDLGCKNGATCINTQGGYSCQCATGYYGIHCTERQDVCSQASHTELCGHGTCINEGGTSGGAGHRCICQQGWTHVNGQNTACTVDINECESGRHCSTNPMVQCINLPGSFRCGLCPAGYTGNGVICSDINECLDNNGGCSLHPRVQCFNTRGSSACGRCPTGYSGDGRVCAYQENQALCASNNGGCHPLATCVGTETGRTCRCPDNLQGPGVGINGCLQPSCGGTICRNGATCIRNNDGARCNCTMGWRGPSCQMAAENCLTFSCSNGGTCNMRQQDGQWGPVCDCPTDYTGPRCDQEYQSCGGLREADVGSINFPAPGVPQYSHNVECAWTITVSSDRVVNLYFTRFDLEHEEDCDYDVLQIYDGTSPSSNLIGSYCGETLNNNGHIASTDNSIYLFFRSDSSEAGQGFQLNWNSSTPTCGEQNMVGDTGTISSPGYPSHYAHNMDCAWTVSVTPGNVILFTFTDLDIEHHYSCVHDWVEIRDGSNSAAPLLSRQCTAMAGGLPAPIRTTGPFAYVRFHTDSSITDRGFRLTYSTDSSGGCGATFTSDAGTIRSPGYPSNYDNNLDCVWNITTSPGYDVLLTFTAFDLEHDHGCDFDEVKIMNSEREEVRSLCGTTLPTPVVVSGNQAIIQFRTDGSVTGTGFALSWSLGCDRHYTQDNDAFFFSIHPSTVCRYYIQVSEGKRIVFQFDAFNWGDVQDETCSTDYLEVFDGDTDSSTQIGGRVCSGNRQDTFRSTGNTMMLRMTGSSSSDVNLLSQAHYYSEEIGSAVCGGAHTGPTGRISSPGFPNIIPSGVNCTWHITVDAGLIISLEFLYLQLPGRTASVCTDFVEVFDGDSTSSQSLGRFCGTIAPARRVSSDNSMTIRYRTGPDVGLRGFRARYDSSNVTNDCGGEFAEPTGIIKTPLHPANYPHGRDCTWIIRSPTPGTQISITFANFTLERAANCIFDYLEIRDGSTASAPSRYKLCGSVGDLPPQPIISTANSFYLHFRSDASITASGFSLEYDTASTGCSATFTSPTGTIISPNYPNPYSHNAWCTWTITVSAGSVINMYFEDFDMEVDSICGYDSLQIRDKDAGGRILTNGTDRLCGNTIPANITSISNKVYIVMSTDYSIAQRGFILHYQQNCSTRLTELHGVIESPNFPHPYPHQMNCSWIIQAPLSNRINVSFVAFNLEASSGCPYDKLQFRNGETMNGDLINEYCGHDIPDPFRSPSNLMLINFRSDHSISHGGFRLEYTFDGCGGIINANSGTLTSPGYPQPYGNNVECLWRVTADMGKSLKVTIDDLDVESSHGCIFDGLEIFAGPDDTGPRIVHLCHTDSSQSIYSLNGHMMYVRFRTDGSVRGKGFRATFETTDRGCGGNFTARAGTITSPGYDSYPTQPMQCEWLITVEQNANVVLNFTELSLVGYMCRGDTLVIFNGANDSRPVGATLCSDSSQNTAFRSSGNQVFLRLSINNSRSSPPADRKGFSLNYTTGCGGEIIVEDNGNSRVIQSPGFPSQAPRHTVCEWTVRQQSQALGTPMSLTFTAMHINSYRDCSSSYVEVSTGPANGTRYCGASLPSAVYGVGQMRVKFFTTYESSRFRAKASLFHRDCGGIIQSDSGRFSTPFFPDNYVPSMECVWQIRVPPGNNLQLSFTQFNLNSMGDVNSDYLEIRTPDAYGTLVGRWIDQNAPTNLTALGGAWIKFRSDDGIPGPGFMAEWNSVYGGTVTGESGQIASPMYPHRYPNNVNYRWIIMVPQDRVVRLDFVSMEMEYDSLCYSDFLKVYDQDDNAGELMGTYCGIEIPGTLYSSTNQVTLLFETDYSIAGTGFLVNWTAVSTQSESTPVCGGRLNVTEDLQTLTSPGNLTRYSNSLNCEWNLNIPEGKTAAINITFMDLEHHYAGNCNFDSLSFSDETGANFGRYCGRRLNDDLIRLKGERAKIIFTTDSSVRLRGFQLNYRTDCGGIIRRMTSYRITSPNYPANYPTNTNCSWSVMVRSGKTITLNFNSTFNIVGSDTCDNDYLQLLNGRNSDAPPLYQNTSGTPTNTDGRYCGSSRPTGLETSSNYLNVAFVSDDSGVAQGFAFNFTEKSISCGGHVRLYFSGGSSERVITSPGYPQGYTDHMDCVWVIIAPAQGRIRVDFEDQFHIENHHDCLFDYVMFRDGGTAYSPPLGNRVCGTVLPSTVVSGGSVLYMRFRTDHSISGDGFKARLSIATCGGRITATSGQFMSPNYPQNYPANQDCEWIITVPDGHFINVTANDDFWLQWSTNCSADYVEIRETNSTGYLLGRYCGRNPIGNGGVASAGSKIWAKFHSDGSSGGKFKLFFVASTEVCGGDLTTSNGVITSPNYPQVYAHRRVCSWKIIVQQGRRITLNFDDFDLEEHASCQYDFLAAYDGVIRGSPQIRRLCGSGVTDTVQSSGNTMALLFRSDHSITHGGFRLTYNSDQDAYCGGELTDQSGNITFPGNLQVQSNAVQCIWRIDNPSFVNSTIVFKFTNVTLATGNECHREAVVIREGRDENSPLVGKYCGTNVSPRRMYAPSRYLFVVFRSRGFSAGNGFRLIYDVRPCGGILTEPGVITSPNYPNGYDHNANCVWKISAPEGFRIRVAFTDFRLENNSHCDYDRLEIMNGGLPDSAQTPPFCGTDLPDDFTSQSNEIRINLVTDHSISDRGFRLEYSFTSGGCGGLKHSPTGEIKSPNHPRNYPHNTECRWDINVPYGNMVKLTFDPVFDLELEETNCMYDYVEIFDSFVNGTLVSKGKWCYNVAPPVTMSSTTRMVVVFRSDFSSNGNGFSASWQSVCGGVFQDSRGTIRSPGYPSNYDNNLFCNYTIQPPPNRIILLVFRDFELESGASCQFDNLTIYQGTNSRGRRLGRFCDNTLPDRIQARSNAYLTFRTDWSQTLKGFEIMYYSQECGGVLTSPAGTISSGFYSLDYLHNLYCGWNITVDPDKIISFKFTSFHLEHHGNCYFDYVAFYDGPDMSSPLLGKYCGNFDVVPSVIQSTGNRMFIRFKTDSSVARGGFHGGYWSTYGPGQGCGGRIERSSGSLSSFDADNDGRYEDGLDCMWTIVADINTVLTLNISDIDIELSSTCNYDSISIYDGPSTDSPLLGKFCGTTPPRQLRGSGNVLLVYFKTDASAVFRGFNATFTSTPSLCGGSYNVTREKHTITSVDYPNPYPDAVRCSWILDTGDPNLQITVDFTDIQMASSQHCPNEYINVMDYPVGNNGQAYHYCGSQLPPPFESSGQMAIIVYNLEQAQGSTARGFSLTYQVSDCNKDYTGNSGHITSPRSSSTYRSNLDCLMNVTTGLDTYLSLYFYEFHLEYEDRCRYDYLEVRNSTSHEIVKICGEYLPDPIFLPDNQAIVRFSTDYSVTHYGYDITYVASTSGPGCGGTISGLPKGVFTSPNYPLSSNTSQTCTWIIRPPARMRLFFRFEHTPRPADGESECSSNHVMVYRGELVQDRSTIGLFCPTAANVFTWNNDVGTVVQYINSGNAPVFKIRFTTQLP